VKSSDFLAYEDLKIASLVKNHHLAKSISDASWGLFLSWVRYYGGLHGIPIIAVPARFTTQDCSGCGYRVKKSLAYADAFLPQLWLGAGSRLQCSAEYPGYRVGAGDRPPPYRRAGGNGCCFGSTQRFGTGRLYGVAREGTSQTGWLNEESPGFIRESVNYCQGDTPNLVNEMGIPAPIFKAEDDARTVPRFVRNPTGLPGCAESDEPARFCHRKDEHQQEAT
jgi:hypothetical protein